MHAVEIHPYRVYNYKLVGEKTVAGSGLILYFS